MSFDTALIIAMKENIDKITIEDVRAALKKEDKNGKN
jgi:hypothetical protein